jgi:hypothetical protein
MAAHPSMTPYEEEALAPNTRAPRVPAPAEVVAGLNDLLQLDHDAVGAYEIAIEQLENRDHAVQIEGFKRDHESHIRDLNEVILGLGGEPTNEPHATAPLKQAIQSIAAVGGDAALLAAWRANELQVTSKYDRYAQEANAWPPEAKRVVDQNALDEERHYQWVVGLLSGGEAPESHLNNKVREGMTRARVAGGKARSQAERVTSSARDRAAEGLLLAADRLDQFATEQSASSDAGGHAAEGARRVARGLASTAAFVRDRGDGDLRSTVAEEIRSNPGRSLVAALAIGFVIGRLLR